MTVAEALRHGAAVLQAAGIEGAAAEARMLLAHTEGLDAAAMLLHRNRAVDTAAFHAALARRATREPMALILGRQGFWTLELEVSTDTLIPRADSEALIEAALAARPARDTVRRVLDLGTGTGCLLLAALAEFPEAWGLGVDLSPAAAALARRNARRCGLHGRAAFVAADWAGAVGGRFDLVLSNPPYIPARDLAGLMPEVRCFEPQRALSGGEDGLCAYRVLLRALPGLLRPGGVAVLELGAGQAEVVGTMAREAGFAPSFRADLGGVPRALVLLA